MKSDGQTIPSPPNGHVAAAPIRSTEEGGGELEGDAESPWSLSLSVGAQVKGATNHINESARHEFGFSRLGFALDHRARQSCSAGLVGQ